MGEVGANDFVLAREMSKRKAKKRRHVLVAVPLIDSAPPPRAEWDSLESEFFAREAELYRPAPVESFDDLDKD